MDPLYAAWNLAYCPWMAPSALAAVGLLQLTERYEVFLHRARPTRAEARDLVLLVAVASVVLPLLPDATIDPWHSLNPRRLGTLAVAMMAIAAAGQFALRLFGSRTGLALAGLAGGFVSSTATVVSMGRKAQASPALTRAAVSAALMSHVGTFMQLAAVVGTFSLPLLGQLVWPLLMASLVAVLMAALAHRGGVGEREGALMRSKRLIEPEHALSFIALLSAVVVGAAALGQWIGRDGIVWVIALSGLVDVHAAAASAAQLDGRGEISSQVAKQAVLAAVAANALLKCTLAWTKGGRAYAKGLVPGMVLVVATFALSLLL